MIKIYKLFFLSLFLFPVSLKAIDIETVDGPEVGVDIGEGASLKVDSSTGDAYIAYEYGNSPERLKLAIGQSGAWTNEIIADGYAPSLDLDSDGNVHLSYLGSLSLIYIQRNKTLGTWGTPETVASGSIYYHSLAVDSSGHVHIAYYEATEGDLWYAKRNESGIWESEQVDTGGDVGQYPSIAVDSSGNVLICHQDVTAASLRCSIKSFATGDWDRDEIDKNADVNQEVSVAIDSSSGRFHVGYFGVGGVVKYATLDEPVWSTEEVDAFLGNNISIAADASGIVHLVYGKNQLLYAKKESSTWKVATLLNEGAQYYYFSLDAAEKVHLAYQNYTTKVLYHSTFNPGELTYEGEESTSGSSSSGDTSGSSSSGESSTGSSSSGETSGTESGGDSSSSSSSGETSSGSSTTSGSDTGSTDGTLDVNASEGGGGCSLWFSTDLTGM